MFAITKAGRDRKDYLRAVRNHLVLIFGLSDKELSKQNKIWEEWLSVKDREYSDLLELLKSNINDTYKARALAILLTPVLSLSPFAWTGDKHSSSRNYLGQNARPLSGLSPALLSFVFELLRLNIDIALAPNADENLRETLFVYNEYILQALSILPTDDPLAKELFERYKINDPIAYCGMEDASGYNPFLYILSAKIPEIWKFLADQKMREIIEAEEDGRIKPRAEWEVAVRSYANHINLCSYSNTPPYSTALLASQVEFVLERQTTVGIGKIMNHRIYSQLKKQDVAKYKELRHKVARQAILVCESYSIFSDNTRSAALEIIEEFEEDEELVVRLNEIIAKIDTRNKEQNAEIDLTQSRINAVLKQMQ